MLLVAVEGYNVEPAGISDVYNFGVVAAGQVCYTKKSAIVRVLVRALYPAGFIAVGSIDVDK